MFSVLLFQEFHLSVNYFGIYLVLKLGFIFSTLVLLCIFCCFLSFSQIHINFYGDWNQFLDQYVSRCGFDLSG